jgi:hypothetical protein
MERETREVWAKRVERWKDSELTAKEFASEIGVNVHSLLWWRWRLGAEAKGEFSPRQRAGGSRSRATDKKSARRESQPLTFVEGIRRVDTISQPDGDPRLAQSRRVARGVEAGLAQGPVRRPESRHARRVSVRGRRGHAKTERFNHGFENAQAPWGLIDAFQEPRDPWNHEASRRCVGRDSWVHSRSSILQQHIEHAVDRGRY